MFMKQGPRGEYDLIDSLRRAKVTNMTGDCFTDVAADELETLRAKAFKVGVAYGELKLENNTLRAALKEILEHTKHLTEPSAYTAAHDCRDTAKEALGE